MCGIIGYIGKKDATSIILDGLEKLEYRGYDSSGISVINGNIKTVKAIGKLSNLTEILEKNPIKGNIGIGHTRWATHGAPSEINSHPHMNNKESISVVHNGIIENYLELKKELEEENYEFISETDSEVIAHLITKYYESDILLAAKKAIKRLRGTYALCIVTKEEPDRIIVARKESPLIIGIGENENFIASDVPALLKYTRKIKYLEDGNIADIKNDNIVIYDENDNIIDLETKEIKWNLESATKNGYPHFMIKEIYEQPKAILETISRRIDKDNNIKLDDIKLSKEYIENIDKVHIIACGTAYHAGLIGKEIIGKLLNVPVETSIGSEFRYNKNFITEKTLVIILSQSGETLDTLVSLKKAKEKKARILSITNVVGSSIARLSDDIFYTWAGPEIAVASTKAYTTQVAALYLIAIYMAKKVNKINEDDYNYYLKELNKVPAKIDKMLESNNMKEIAKTLKDVNNGFYLGRGVDKYIAMEASLKMKEISYMHTEAFPSGELKHGSIALIEDNTLTVFIATQEKLYEKTLSNIKEVKARNARTIVITKEDNKIFENISNDVIYIPKADDDIMPLFSIVPLQLLAYHTSVEKGYNVDKPRNLAKSVTVE